MMAIINVAVGRREDQQAVAQPAGLLRIVVMHHRATGQQGGRQGLNPRTGEVSSAEKGSSISTMGRSSQRARQRARRMPPESRRAGVGAG